MALVDEYRRYVAANDALVELYRFSREEIIGTRAGSGIPGEDPAIGETSWEQLVETGELYGERLVKGAGAPMRVSFAAHATYVEGRWLALFVVLSARPEPDGEELIGLLAPTGGARSATRPVPPPRASSTGRLTPREREIVQRVALGRSTPQIALDLNLSPATVRSHIRNAMVKTASHTRAQLVALVLGEGLASE